MNEASQRGRGVIMSCLTTQPGGIDRVLALLIAHRRHPSLSYSLVHRALPGFFGHSGRLDFARELVVGGPGTSMLRGQVSIARALFGLALDGGNCVLNPHDPVSLWYSVLAKMRRPGVRVCATVHQLQSTRYSRKARRRLLIGMERTELRRCDRIIAVSSQRESELRVVGVCPSRVRVVYNGVVLPELPRFDACRKESRGGQGEGHATLRIGYAGRLSREKGPLDLVPVCKALDSSVQKHVRFFVAGGGLLRDELAMAIKLSGLSDRFELLGHVGDLGSFYELIDVLILPSYDEGISLSLLEAMSHRVPPIASRAGGTPEVVEHHRSGWLVAPGDIDGMAAAIREAFNDPAERERRGLAARERVTQSFSVERMVRETEAVFLAL